MAQPATIPSSENAGFIASLPPPSCSEDEFYRIERTSHLDDLSLANQQAAVVEMYGPRACQFDWGKPTADRPYWRLVAMIDLELVVPASDRTRFSFALEREMA